MRFRIVHQTSYRYDRPVILGRHTFRLRPREDSFLHMDNFSFVLFPRPVDEKSYVDPEGNLVISAIFEGQTQECLVRVASEGETSRRPPLREAGTVVAISPPDDGSDGAAMENDRESPGPTVLLLPSPAAVSAPVAHLTRRVLSETGLGALDFLEGLSREIHRDFRNVPRPSGPPLPPEQTVQDRQGSCRDLAVLFIASCRSLGLEARFVSGYIPAPPGEPQHMHAWSEVLLPEYGWIPFDPTHSEGVGEEHIPVAAAAAPADAAPVTGSYSASSGGFARSEMSVELSVRVG